MSSPALFPPFRADHVGSFKRPVELLQKRAAFEKDECNKDDLRPIEDKAIKAIVELQREVGIKSITDGEFRRYIFYEGVFNNLEGMKHYPEAPPHMLMDYHPVNAMYKKIGFHGSGAYICVGKLKRTKPFYIDQFQSLKSFTKPEEHKYLKMTICPPEAYHLKHGEYAYNKDVYKNDEEFFADIVLTYKQELEELYAIGCRNIQVDDPYLTFFCSTFMIEGMEKKGIDHQALLETYIRTYNKILEGRPKDLTVGMHLCRGNFRDGVHFSSGGYDQIAIKLFNEINVDCYYLEFDTDRAGSFEPLRFLPKHKTVVLGLISSKVPELEDPEDLKARVEQAARIIADGNPKRSYEDALNQLCISPQCGFASVSEGNPVTEEDMKKKLGLVVNTAKSIWLDA